MEPNAIQPHFTQSRFNQLFVSCWMHILLLGLWCAIALGIRLTNLALKPLWTDEFSTLVFSLGNSFQTVPLNQVISLQTLLQPLIPNPQATSGDVVQRLLTESNHPPLYFVLTHGWLQLFPPPGGYVSVWGARSLAALFGVATIPAMFGLGWLAFHSRRIGHLAALLMAVSPFGVYLAQEARHYTLPTLWGILSLCCMVVAVRAIRDRQSLPLPIVLSWIILNSLGVATHYFFTLTIAAEAIALLGLFFLRSWRKGWSLWTQPPWWRVVIAGIGTVAGCAIWLPFLQTIPDNELSYWVFRDDAREGLRLLDPLVQTLAGIVTMLYLLPVVEVSLPMLILSAIGLLALTVWTGIIAIRGLRLQWSNSEYRLGVQSIGGFLVSAIALFWGIAYGLNTELTQGFRYNFVYFPAVILLLAASLNYAWAIPSHNPTMQDHQPSLWNRIGCPTVPAVMLIGFMGLVGSLLVATNYGYQKIHRPEVVAQSLSELSEGPTLISISHQTHGQVGRLMGLAWQLRSQSTDQEELLAADNPPPHPISTIQFFLDHQDCVFGEEDQCHKPTPHLQQILTQQPRPFDLWLVNYHWGADLQSFRCQLAPPAELLRTDGYQYYRFVCPP